jgi:uncharacterized protein (DUF2267 family)
VTRPSMEDLLERLARRGLEDAELAARALRATLAVLGERLVDDEATALVEVLPPELGRLVENVEYDTDFSSAELYHRVARRERTTDARAKEVAEIVIAALGESMDDDHQVRLARALPDGISDLLLGRPERPRGEPPPYGTGTSTRRREKTSRTLATGRPGSEHPLSEAPPPSGHAHSVARNPVPHSDTNLSTSSGLTQERLHETLAEARRGTGR